MSYILDALRRADAERQRGAVPGLHAQPAPLPPADGPAAGRSVPLGWVLGGAGLLAALALAAWWMSRETPTPPVAAPAAPAAVVVPAWPAPPVVAASMAASMPLPAAVPTPPPVSASVAPVPVAAAPAPPPPAPKAAVAAKAPPARASRPAAAEAASAPAPVPALAELPEPLRRQLPRLVVGGSMYSDDPARRLVIVNGQVAHEGDEVAAELRLQQIQPHAAVFSFRGQLFRIGL